MKRLLQLALLLMLLCWCAPAQATFPTLAAAPTTTIRDTSATDDVCNLPASIAAGDLIILIHAKDLDGTRTFPGSWVEIKDVTIVATASFGAAYLIAAGGETTVTVTTTASDRMVCIAFRIAAANWHGTTPPEISTGTTGTSAAPDPDAVTASWGSADNLFVAISARDESALQTTSAYPTNYGANNTEVVNVSSGACISIGTRELAAASDDPGAFTITASEQWDSFTLVIKPAAGGAAAAGFNKRDKLEKFEALNQ